MIQQVVREFPELQGRRDDAAAREDRDRQRLVGDLLGRRRVL